MSKIKDFFNEILDDFADCTSKMEKLELVLEFGRELEINELIKLPQNKVPGCTSNVYINCFLEDSKVKFEASSDALIVGGYIAILFEGLKDNSKEEILKERDFVYEFAKKAGVKESLTPTRANAFANILEMIFSKVEKL